MTSNSDPHFNLADALSEDLVAAPANVLVDDAGSGPGDRAASIASFDRIAARAAAQSRRRRIVERLRGVLHAIPAPIGWTSAVAAAAASVFAVGIIGGVHFHQQTAQVAPPILADRMASTSAPAMDKRSLAYANNPAAPMDQAAATISPPPAPVAPPPVVAAAPPVVAAAPPPAPPAAAGVEDAPRPVPTVTVRDDAAGGGSANAPPPRVLSGEMLENALRNYQIALAIERHAKVGDSRTASAPATAAPAAESAYAPATLDPAPRLRSARTASARQDDVAKQDNLALSFAWPLRGRVLAAFGQVVDGVPNNGIDVAVPVGSDIRAAEAGVVAYAGPLDSFGNMILLRHPDGYITVYAHARSLTVKPGDTVRRGQVIAKSGQTGTAAAPQLHFEIRKGETAVNPAQYLPPPPR